MDDLNSYALLPNNHLSHSSLGSCVPVQYLWFVEYQTDVCILKFMTLNLIVTLATDLSDLYLLPKKGLPFKQGGVIVLYVTLHCPTHLSCKYLTSPI